ESHLAEVRPNAEVMAVLTVPYCRPVMTSGVAMVAGAAFNIRINAACSGVNPRTFNPAKSLSDLGGVPVPQKLATGKLYQNRGLAPKRSSSFSMLGRATS